MKYKQLFKRIEATNDGRNELFNLVIIIKMIEMTKTIFLYLLL